MVEMDCYDFTSDPDKITVVRLNVFPDQCPFCHYSLVPKPIIACKTIDSDRVEAVFQCTRLDCNHLFIGYYEYTPGFSKFDWSFRFCLPKKRKKRTFPNEIIEVSSSFAEIYNEALSAENERLNHIAGMGYRKALEFLIKDYLINYKKINRGEIEKKYLGQCINEYIDHPTIKELAKRAAWLGNDESHFVRKWEDKSIKDLKTLIDLVVSWIHQIILSEKLIASMPEKK